MNLDRCPCCGGEAEYCEELLIVWVECAGCGLQTIGEASREAAANRWNSRPSPWVPVSERRNAPRQTELLLLLDDGKWEKGFFSKWSDGSIDIVFCNPDMDDETDRVTHFMLVETPAAPETKGE